jgi:urease accessory protein
VTNLPALLHLCDSLFPTGGFAHSEGLEAAAANGDVATAAHLSEWMRALLHGSLRDGEGRGVALATRYGREERWLDLSALDDELFALRPSRSGREATRATGTRLLKTWLRLRPCGPHDAFLQRRGPDGVTLPVAFGLACLSCGIDARGAVEAFLYTRLAGTASASMRVIAIGQTEAHRVLTELLAAIPDVAAGVAAGDASPSAFTPALDVAAMSHQYVESRLFRS